MGKTRKSWDRFDEEAERQANAMFSKKEMTPTTKPKEKHRLQLEEDMQECQTRPEQKRR